MKKKIIAISSSRSELGLQKQLYNKLASLNKINFIPIITGDNLNNYKFNDLNNLISKKIRKLNYNHRYHDNKTLIKSISNLIKISNFLEDLKPDLILVMGDRYEIFYICSIAFILRIPICHLSGGEITNGSLDNTYRNAISMMSNLHLVSTDKSKNNLLKFGIKRTSIKVVGEIGLQNINEFNYLSLNQISKNLKISLKGNLILLAMHPETFYKNSNLIIKNVIKVLNMFSEYTIISTSANNDPGGNEINELLKKNTKKNSNFLFFENLGRDNFISLLKLSKIIIGNSSSGIVEAPSLKTLSIDIGKRQEGRERAKSVYHSDGTVEDLKNKINKCLSMNKKKNKNIFNNPYEKKNSLQKILEHIINYEK